MPVEVDGVLREFNAFLMKNNILALALAVVVGTALAAVVGSLVADIIMPPVGLLLGGVDFQSLYLDLSGKGYPTLAAAKAAGAATINYGSFLNTVIIFVIVAFVVFLIAKAFVKEAPAAPVKACGRCTLDMPLAASRCPHCTSEVAA